MQAEKAIYLSSADLIARFKKVGAPLPFSRSSLDKDRLTGCLGGIPYRRIGALCLYLPDEVLAWLSELPIIQSQRHPAISAVRRRGKPTKIESVEASRRGLTVKQFRAQTIQANVK
jgi:hypothetical protein